MDANNLNGWAMSLPLPKGGFKWKRVMPTQEQIIKLKENSRIGWILEVDLEYPEELHEPHNSYTLAPEKNAIGVGQISGYQKRMMEDLELNSEKRETGAHAEGQKQVRRPLQEPAVLHQPGDAFEKSPPGDRVRPGAVDGALHPDEHGV